MMSGFARLTFSLVTLTSLFLGVTLTLSSTLLNTAHTSLFTANSCTLPCLFGVTPGVTLRNDAMMILERQGLSYSFLSQNQSASFTTRENRSVPQSTLTLLNFGAAGDMRVTATYLYQMTAGNDLGILSDFLLASYQPIRVFSNCQSIQRIYIVFEQQVMVQIAFDHQLKLDDQVMMVASARDDEALRPVGGFACETVSDWLGFAPLWKYQACS
jgi:hypothetical protein